MSDLAKGYSFDGEVLSFKLLKKLTIDGIPVSELRLRDLSVGEEIEIDDLHGSKSQRHQDAALFARMADKPIELIMSMSSRDFKRMRGFYWETLGNVDWEPSEPGKQSMP